MARQIPDFETKIAGIPAGILVTYFAAGTNRPINSASLEPNDPDEIEYKVLDRKGYPANWLEEKITPEDEDRICRLIREAH